MEQSDYIENFPVDDLPFRFKSQWVCLLVTLLLACKTNTFPSSPSGGVSASPDPITISQPDGTTITIIGKGNIQNPYTETIDGYTLLLNEEGVYEYAKLSKGQLTLSGIKAHDPKDRSRKEVQFLTSINHHLRTHK